MLPVLIEALESDDEYMRSDVPLWCVEATEAEDEQLRSSSY